MSIEINFCESEKQDLIKPREKMQLYGPGALTDSELLSTILGVGYRNRPVDEISRQLLDEFGLRGLFEILNLEEFQKKTGLGFAKSCQIMAIAEYFKRLNRKDMTKIKSPEQLYEYIISDFRNIKFEQLRMVCLDYQRRVLFNGLICQGQGNRMSVYLSELFYHPIRLHSKIFYLIHNHPQGSVDPSSKDISFTLEVKKYAKKLGLNFDDHLIINSSEFYSFARKGLL